MKGQYEVSVVTVNYNHATYLPQYVESLRRSTYPIAEIIVVDNGSTDDSLDILLSYPNVCVIPNETNVGYSAALNQAFEAATSPLVCATGPDVVVEPDWLQPLVAHYSLDPDNIFAVGSHVLTYDRRQHQAGGGSLHYTGHLCVYQMWEPVEGAHSKTGRPVEVGAISSTSALFDRVKFIQVGGCDADFFVYHEEFDYCYRARMRGWKCFYHPASVVYHGAGTPEFSVRGSGDYPSKRPYFHTRNRLLSILKNYQLRTLLGLLPVILPVEALYFSMLIRLGFQEQYIESLLWHWTHRCETIGKRRKIQSQRRIQDGDLLSADALTVTPLVLQRSWLSAAKGIVDYGLALYWRLIKVVLYR